MKKNIDLIFSRILLVISVVIIIYWAGNGLSWLWEWYGSVSAAEETTVWTEIGLFINDYLSVFALAYGILALQASGLAELKFEKNFLKAFGLAIVLTPPVMMILYGHKKGH